MNLATTHPTSSLLEGDHITPRCIRHITSIQVRNLTPFPFRDAVTTALSQPAEQQIAGPYYSMDDFETISSKRRPRKASSSSTATRIAITAREDDDSLATRTETRGRAVSFSRNIRERSPTSPPTGVGGQSYSSSRSIHSLRARRARTSSLNSSASLFTNGTSDFRAPILLFQNSQSALEKVLRSRLVETLVILTLPIDTVNEDQHSYSHQPPPQRALSTALRSAPIHKTSFNTLSPPKRSTLVAEDIVERKTTKVKPNRLYINTNGTAHDKSDPLDIKAHTVYRSSVHRPSTNPIFPFDFSSHGPSALTGLTGHRLAVEIWGRDPSQSMKEDSKTDHRPRPLDYDLHSHRWRKLDTWDVDLSDLVPLPEASAEGHYIQLPSNTLVVTLAPLGRAFYLPVRSESRSATPSPGYNSDPETKSIGARKQAEDAPTLTTLNPSTGILIEPSSATLRHLSKTATWQDIFKLVTVQSCIIDHEISMKEIGASISRNLDHDGSYASKREISQKEAFVKQVQEQKAQVLLESHKARLMIVERERDFARRKEVLRNAKGVEFFDKGLIDVIEIERVRLLELNKKISSLRTSLINVLCTIYPIELYSPPDLLFTILDIPLPIPVSVQDPAPPLSMADHKEVTEEGIATGFGYVAQVLQLLSGYLGKSLVYPVTCVGSRSVIKDGISAMVGPRIFPLYSKGVDTYRFEYAVFLINKNIEILMADRDLRALDLRHTLPNLKNLLLTLSHGASSVSYSLPRPISVSSLNSAVGTPERESSPVGDASTTPKGSELGGRCNSSETLLPNEGQRTPTNGPDDAKKGGRSAFLGFGPLSDFLRVRYPSTSTREGSVNGAEEANMIDGDSGQQDEEEDRKTIQGHEEN